MKLSSKIFLSLCSLTLLAQASNVNITTKYGQTGGVLGPLNKTTDLINGREICKVNPTAGCDFDNDPKFNNNNTVDDPSDDTYSGDLLVRTNDQFQAIAGWTWNGVAGGSEEVATITGTLPTSGYYEWVSVPGSCNPDNSSISADKQTIICERKDFDKNDAGTYSEDLVFNVRVLGGTPNGTKPGDIKFKVEAPSATTVEDTTDGNSLTVTASPRWNLDKSFGAYAIRSGQKVTINGEEREGWVIDYRLLIETDEVNGETDNTYSLLGNESLGADATLTFTDSLAEVSSGATLLECRMTGRAYSDSVRDGYVGSNLPVTFSGAGSIKSTIPDMHIPQAKDVQEVTCVQNGTTVNVELKHVDATLNHYPTRDYDDRPLPVNRAIASIVTMSVFVPLEDVKAGPNGTVDCDGFGIGNDDCDDGELKTINSVTDFNPVSASGIQNFSGEGESEKDNYYTPTLQYSAGSFDKYYVGEKDSIWTLPAEATRTRQGDRFVGKGYEWSSRLYSVNSGGIDQQEDSFCDVIDANYMEIIKYSERTNYTDTRYSHEDELPFILYTSIGKGDPDNHIYYGAKLSDYYDFEFAGDYEDDSFLASNNNNRQDANQDAKTRAECDAPANKWYATMDEARNAAGGVGAVTKVRWKLKDGKIMAPGQNGYWMLFHRVRSNRLDNNEPLKPGDMMVNYGKHKFDGNQGTWSNTTYIPHGLDANGMPEGFSGGAGDRIFYTDAKVRIQKEESRTTATPGNEVTYSLHMSFTDDIRTAGERDSVVITDVLPKDFKYQKGSIVPATYDEPTIGTCADVQDIISTESPCIDGDNQVLIWDLGTREINMDIEDLNYTVLIGAAAKVGVNTNIVKIESPSDVSPISQRKAEIGLDISVPASINIVKSTEENPDYPSKRERTTEAKDIFFLMDMRNGKAGDITDLDVIDILPFSGDADEGAIKFNDLELKRKVATDFHGSMIFHEASFQEHPGSDTACDMTANGGIKYYYTNADPKTINMAPTVGNANDITHADSIWCEGDASGPNGCSVNGVSLTNATVTAVRARGPRMEKQAICQFKVHVSVKDNLDGDNYSNSAGASATGITLPVLSNSLAVPIVGSSLGDRVWYDRDADGIQDEGENGIAGVKVHLLDASGTPVKNPTNPTEDYVVTTDAEGKYSFEKLNQGSYQVVFDKPADYIVSPKTEGANTAVDSNIDLDGKTDVISLGVDEDNPTIDAGFFTPIISGNIFADGNGDASINGTKISTVSGEQLHATLLAEDGTTVLATTPIAADGSYEFDGDDNVTANKNYVVVLSTVAGATVPSLPDGWNNADGEHVGTGAGTDGQNAKGEGDGKIAVKVLEENVPNVNFGINEKPVAQDKTEPSQLNPGADVKVSVPDLNVTDREDGTPSTITITKLPTNGKLYYDGALVVEGEAILNADPSKFTVDPIDGDQTVVFNYTTTDKVGVVSDPATVTMPFRGLKISGNVFDDGSGDNTINGTKINNPDGTALYATLIDTNGVAIATMPISGDGSYRFDGEDGIKPNTTYSVVLSTEANGTTPSLPLNWNNADGEHIGTNEGTDATADGIISVSVEGVDIPEINFGINKKPEAKDKEEPVQANPGEDEQVVVPTLSVTDKEDGSTPPTVTITKLPTNGKLYYDGAEVSQGDDLTDFDPNKFTVDPDNGDQTLIFNYTVTDRAGVVSDEAKVTLPFNDIVISGTLFDDGNANGDVDGNATAKADDTQLYVTLVDENGVAVASKPLAADGTYSFSNEDGVKPNTNYTMVLSDVENGTTAKLPENWNNADGENIGLTGLDGLADGKTVVEVKTTSIPNINFGINKKPEADDKTEPIQFNPGSDVQVDVPTLTVSDKEDGIPAVVTIRTLPNNATLYYDSVEVTVDMEIVDLSLLTVDPLDGDQTVKFTYTSTDVTGMISDPATVIMPFKGIQIAGNVFNDGNADGTVNGNPIASPSATQLHATLLDANGTAIATTPIAEDGTYSFGNKDGVLPNHEYSVVLSTTANSTTADLPLNWNNADGEHIGTDAGLDDAPDGVIAVNVVETDVVQVNFGINKRPVAGDNTGEEQLNPGTDVQVNVIDLKVSDDEDETPSTVTIKKLPVNGTLYYDGVEVIVGQVIENFDNSKLTLDPNNGTLTVSFTYTTTDDSGVESEEATIAMPFKGLKISGNIFNDGNNNGTVDGNSTSKVDDAPLYAVLLDANGEFMAREAIKDDGSYDFDGLDGVVPNSNYSVVLTSDANGTRAKLPLAWNNADGEHIGTDAGLDGVADGLIDVAVTVVDVPQVNFGINKRPIADDKTEPEQLNMSRDEQYVVPTLTVSDKEDGIPTIITIRTLPTNGTLYYDGNPVEVNATIADPSKLTIDPNDGDQNVTFTYTSTDVTGAVSDPATVVMPFIGVKISGYIFADGNNDNTVNGKEISMVDGIQLYATLLNDNNETLSTVAIDSNGSYLFGNSDGVYPNHNYRVILSTQKNATTASLPANWNNADGEHIGRDKGLDDNANGMIDVSVETVDVPEVNFGINKRPVVVNVEAPVQSNPGADKQVNVIDLGISDNEDGSPKTVTIVILPTNGTLYYDGKLVEEGQVIPNFNNKLLTVDPKNGATDITFEYTTTDNTGWESEKAKVTMSFSSVAPSGNFIAVDDAVPASLEGPVTTINVLENDGLGENNIIHLLDTKNGTILWNDGTAVGSASIETEDSVVVPGEGVWTVHGNTVVFTAEDGFEGIPTPIYYVVEDEQGNQTNAAQVAVISNCVCNTYEESVSDSVSALSPWTMSLGVLIISVLGALFARREFEIE